MLAFMYHIMLEHILCRSLFVVQQSFLFWEARIIKHAIVSKSFMLCSVRHCSKHYYSYAIHYYEGGFPAATIKWMFSDIVISANSKYTITDSDNSTQISINNVNTSDAGIYYCKTTNLAGSSTAVIALDVQSKNIICLTFMCTNKYCKYFTFFAFFLPSSPWH